ncbi:putative ribonuclease H-like domain-containing protein [Tanacetum coccineum]
MTPYELLHGRPPSISFMRPFRCPVTILNTLDPLGKFDEKADEGFFVGYSINSKAFRVLNTRTRKVEENLNINFLENKPNVARNGPDWLFDIDLLTNSMNYKPSSKDAVADDAGKKTNEEPANEGERNGFANSTNRDSTVSPSVSTTRQIFTNVDDLSIDPLIPDLKDTGIFSGAYDDEDVGAEADLNKLETTMNVSPIPITRIHKDHPKDQIIGDINSATQTRRMTKISKEHAMVSYIKKQRRTNHKYYQNCLFAYFISQIEPKKVIQALTDPIWIEAMQEELLQFKLQKVWTLVDLPKGKRAIRTNWVYRNNKYERGIVVRNKARLMDMKSAFLYGTIEEETAIVRIVDNGEQEITTTADGKEFTITEASVRRHLQLADVDGMLAIQAEEGEDKAVYKEWDDIVERATTTAASLDAAQASGNITKTQSTEIPNVPLPQGISAVVVLSLEEVLKQTKQVYGVAYTKLITKVKKLEKIVKTRQARRRAKIMVSDDKEELEDSSKQGRMIEETDQDAGVTLVTPTHTKNVHTYTRRRRAVSTGSGGVSTASRLFSTAKESVSTTVSLHCRLVLWYVQELTKIKLDEEERQRIARVHEEASSFNIEEWEDIQAIIEADEELAQRIQAKEREKYSKAEKARLLVELINHRKRYFAQQRAR